jgi:anaerobic selenocysteine-containing dehydrogenase
VPLYAGIERLRGEGDQVQWGGPLLYEDGVFATPDGKAHFTAVVPPARRAPEGSFYVSTRRGKQFNSMVQRDTDPLTGARREDVLVAPEDAARLGLADGDAVRLRSRAGTFTGRARLDRIKPGNLEVHWPEGNVLLAGDRRSDDAGMPDYNARVTLEPISPNRPAAAAR